MSVLIPLTIIAPLMAAAIGLLLRSHNGLRDAATMTGLVGVLIRPTS